MAKKQLSGSVKLFPQETAPQVIPIIPKAPVSKPVASEQTIAAPLSVRELNKKKKSIFDKKRPVVVDVPIEAPKIEIPSIVFLSTKKGGKKKSTKSGEVDKEYISIENGTIRLALFDSNIATLQKYHTMRETDMIARRVRNMLIFFIEFSLRIIAGAIFEDESQKKLLTERIALSRAIIKRWDNLPDISDMTMNRVRKDPKDKR